MKSNWIGRTPTSLVWPATALVAIGVWLWREQGPGAAVLVGAVALILIALVRFIWLSRVRAARRFQAAVDAYAQREIDRERRAAGSQRLWSGSAGEEALPVGLIDGW